MTDRLIISEDGMSATLDETIQLQAELIEGSGCSGCYLQTKNGCLDVLKNIRKEGADCTPTKTRRYIIWKQKE